MPVIDLTWFLMMMLMMLRFSSGACRVRAMQKHIQILNDQVAFLEQSIEDMNDADDDVPEPPPAVPVARPLGIAIAIQDAIP